MGRAVIDGGRRDEICVNFPRFTCAPEIRMPRFTLPSFQGIVKAVAGAMSDRAAFAATWNP